MYNYTYYPFKRNLQLLDTKELSILKTVAEGWYIEYKSQPLKKVEDLAKHLSGFANQYGGFLLIGVNESDDGSKCAGAFPGVDNADLANLSIQIREACSAHINPPILYEEQVIHGPCEEIGLSADKAIVIIGVPKSVNTPHIHSSGRIYRRQADQSAPKAETDRYILDDLWKRGESHRQKVSKFLCETPPLPASASNSSWAYVYVRPDENRPKPNKKVTFEEFTEIATNQNNIIQGPYALMDAIYNAPNGYIARQTKGNNPTQPSFTFRWWHDGTARFEIPLNKFNLKSLLSDSKNKHALECSVILKRIGFEHAILVDYSKLLISISALMNMHLELLKKAGDTRDLYSSFILKNISYTSPYLDTAHYLSKIEKFSLPLTIESEIRIPENPNQSTMFQHKYEKLLELTNQKPNSEIVKPIVFAAPLFVSILQCAGVLHGDNDLTDDIEMFDLGVTYRK